MSEELKSNNQKGIKIGIDAANTSNTSESIADIIALGQKSIEEASKKFGESKKPEQKPEEPLTEEPFSFERAGGGVARVVSPYLVAAGAGALAGSVIPGAGTIAGAGAGLTALALSDLTISLGRSITGKPYKTSSEVAEDLFDLAGIPNAKTNAEKVIKKTAEITGAMGGAAGEAKVLSGLASSIAKPVTKRVLTELGARPAEQALATGGALTAQEVARQQKLKIPVPKVLEKIGITPETAAQTTAAILGGIIAPSTLKTPSIPSFAERIVFPEEISKTMVKAISGDKEAARRMASAAASKTPEMKKSLQETGLQAPTELTSASPEYKALSQSIASAPGSQSEAFQKQAIDELKAKAESALQKAGSTEDLSGISDNIRKSMSDTISSHANTEKVLYDKIGEAIDTKEFSASNTLEAIQKEIQKLGGKGKDLSKMERDILEKLSPETKVTQSTILDEFGNPISSQTITKNPTYYKINEIKKDIGEFIHNYSGPYKNERVGKAKYYYEKLVTDLDSAAKNDASEVVMHDGTKRKVSDLVKDANKNTQDRKDIEERTIQLFGRKLSDSISGKISTAGKATAKGDADKIRNILNAVPENFRNEVSASAINNAISKKGEFNISQFVDWYGGIKENKKAYDALFQHIPKESRADIDNLYTISKNVNDSLKNRVQTGRLSQAKLIDAYRNADTLIGKIKHIAKSAGIGAVVGIPLKIAASTIGFGHGLASEVGAAVTGAVAGSAASATRSKALKSADDFLTSPEFAKLVDASAGNPTEFSRVYKLIEKTPVWKRFAKATGITAAQRASLFSQQAIQQQTQEDQIEYELKKAEQEQQ